MAQWHSDLLTDFTWLTASGQPFQLYHALSMDSGCRATTQLQLEGVIASAAHCDVTNKAEVDALVNWTVQTYGAIDLLVANAGIVKGADFLDMTEQDFDDVIRVNLKGVFLVSYTRQSRRQSYK